MVAVLIFGLMIAAIIIFAVSPFVDDFLPSYEVEDNQMAIENSHDFGAEDHIIYEHSVLMAPERLVSRELANGAGLRR